MQTGLRTLTLAQELYETYVREMAAQGQRVVTAADDEDDMDGPDYPDWFVLPARMQDAWRVVAEAAERMCAR